MSSIITDGGDSLVADLLLGLTTEELSSIAVGTDGTPPTESDTSLAQELYRSTKTDSNVALELTGTTPGEFLGRITVSGGTEVPSGTDIEEIGLFGDQDTLVYRETFSPVTLDAGDRKTFEFTIEVDN